MASKTEISNMALSHLGAGGISDLETETSQEAAACRTFYDIALDAILRDFSWPFATKIAALGLVEEKPNTLWGYSYLYPTDCLQIRSIPNNVSRVYTTGTRVPYRVVYGETGSLIYSDFVNAEIEYTVRVTDPMRYPPDFTLAFSFRLAAYVAPKLTGGDPFKLGERALKFYEFELRKAKLAALNERQVDLEAASDLERARN